MAEITELSQKIKNLKETREILYSEYTKTDFHKKREDEPLDRIPPSPEDKEIIKLLEAINQIDVYIKKFQDEQLSILKENE